MNTTPRVLETTLALKEPSKMTHSPLRSAEMTGMTPTPSRVPAMIPPPGSVHRMTPPQPKVTSPPVRVLEMTPPPARVPEMTPPPVWTPGMFLARGDSTVLDMPHPVSDPARCVRHPTGCHVPSDLLYMPMKTRTSYFPLSASMVLVLAFLGILGVASFTLFTYTHSWA